MKIFHFLILFLITPVTALQSPDSYLPGQCELAAKDYQREFGGSLVWIQPITASGAFENTDGHIINHAWDKINGSYYIDYAVQERFNTTQDVRDWMWNNSYFYDFAIYDLAEKRPPFSIAWKY